MAQPGEDHIERGDFAELPDDHPIVGEIMCGDVQTVRDYFDGRFWKGLAVRPTWRHLRLALQRADKPMMKLLVAWGARATEEDLMKLRAAAKDKYRDCIKLLRSAGLALPPGTEDLPAAEYALPQMDADRIPDEWRKVLQAVQARGAREAMIAGGALRDLFNARAVKDVDIFLKTRGSMKKNREFLREVFNCAGLQVKDQPAYTGDYYASGEAFPAPEGRSLTVVHDEGGNVFAGKAGAESWKVIAGPEKTEYNFVFIHDAKLSDRVSLNDVNDTFFRWNVVSGFDLGLCQIFHDGREIGRTLAFEEDIKQHKITMLQPNDTSKDHLQRVAKKYPDWELCEKSQQLLSKKPSSGDWHYYTWPTWGWR